MPGWLMRATAMASRRIRWTNVVVGGEVRVEQLHRDLAVEHLVGAEPHLRHAADGDATIEPVAADQPPWPDGRRRWRGKWGRGHGCDRRYWAGSAATVDDGWRCAELEVALAPARPQDVAAPPEGQDDERPDRQREAEAAQPGGPDRELRARRQLLVALRREEVDAHRERAARAGLDRDAELGDAAVNVTLTSLPSGKRSFELVKRTFTRSGSSVLLVIVIGSSEPRPARVMVRAGTGSTERRSPSSWPWTASR